MIQGGYEGKRNVDRDPGFADDVASGRIAGRRFDPAAYCTQLKLDAETGGDLAGRPIRVGRQWNVVRLAGKDRLVIWGEITDPAQDFFIPRTYTPK